MLSTLVALPAFAQSTQEEKTAVRKTLLSYITNTHMEDVFHSKAQLKFIKDGKYQQIPSAKFVQRASKQPRRSADNVQISSLTIAGNAAFAKLESQRQQHLITDYISLLKIDGHWKIVSKVFSVQNNVSLKSKSSQSLWFINHMQLRNAADYKDYMDFLRLNWAAGRAEGKRQGYIKSFRVLTLPAKDMVNRQWNLLLLTEYPGEEKMKAFGKNWDKIIKKVNPHGVVKIKSKGARDFANRISGFVLREPFKAED